MLGLETSQDSYKCPGNGCGSAGHYTSLCVSEGKVRRRGGRTGERMKNNHINVHLSLDSSQVASSRHGFSEGCSEVWH